MHGYLMRLSIRVPDVVLSMPQGISQRRIRPERSSPPESQHQNCGDDEWLTDWHSPDESYSHDESAHRPAGPAPALPGLDLFRCSPKHPVKIPASLCDDEAADRADEIR